jgi:hypothetical protein
MDTVHHLSWELGSGAMKGVPSVTVRVAVAVTGSGSVSTRGAGGSADETSMTSCSVTAVAGIAVKYRVPRYHAAS